MIGFRKPGREFWLLFLERGFSIRDFMVVGDVPVAP